MLGNLMYQTRPPDEIIVLVSDPGDLEELKEDFPLVTFHLEENRNDWGHEKRAKGLELANGEWVGFFNDDDSYSEQYLEKMLEDPDADVVYCSWNTIPSCDFRLGSSTSGNYIVRTELARRVGYSDRHYEADGTFINALRSTARKIVRVSDLLYHHNFQR